MKAAYTLAAAVGLILSTTAPAAAQPDGKRELLGILRDIGGEVTSSADGKNSKVYYFRYTSNRRSYNLRACLSSDNSRVWISLPLRRVDRAAAAAYADRLFKLLGHNQDTGPRHFKISGGMLYLSGALENRDLGNAQVRRLVEDLIGDLEQTRNDWDRDWARPTPVTYGRGD
jgi:hypothetical protein